MVTLDGFFEGPQKDISWHNVDEEFNEFAGEQLDSVDALLFGRVTYELMASYWPTEIAATNDPIIAEKMNNKPKIVFSTTLENAEWNNSTLIKENIGEATSRLKQLPGRDMAIFGSANLGNTLLEAGLVDEIRIMVNPVLIGQGRPLFENRKDKLDLKLLNSGTFTNGNVLLTYQPVKKAKSN
jgi:dihydrofolate reductase